MSRQTLIKHWWSLRLGTNEIGLRTT